MGQLENVAIDAYSVLRRNDWKLGMGRDGVEQLEYVNFVQQCCCLMPVDV